MQTLSIVAQFALATILPAVVGAGLVLMRRTRFGQMPDRVRQVVFGLVFGAVAIFGTEFGIDAFGATMNVRDAAPLVAGLYFGSPAGIIAGIIGGVERWFSVLWGRGEYTQVACSVATAAVGFYAAALNRFLFGDRRPSWPMAAACGVVAEVLHMTLVLLTHLDDAVRAFQVVEVCSAPMIACNGIAAALAGIAIGRASGKVRLHHDRTRDISQVIQVGMLGVVLAGFCGTVGLTFLMQQASSNADSEQTLTTSLSDVIEEVRDASDDSLLTRVRWAAELVPSVEEGMVADLDYVAYDIEVTEVNVVDADGIIVASTDESLVGFDMASGPQSFEFLKLLPGERTYEYVQEFRPMTADDTQWKKYAGKTIRGGFVQVCYDEAMFMDQIGAGVRAAVRNRHVGTNGFLCVLGPENTLLAMRSDVSMADMNVRALASQLEGREHGTVLGVSLHDEEYLCMYEDVEAFRVIALLPRSEALQARNASVLMTTFMEVLVFAALFAAIFVLIHHVVVSSIWQVNGTLDKITSGDLEAKVEVRDSTEFASLSDDINRTVAALRDAIAQESARIEADLRTAKAIQESALPQTFPPFPDVDAFDIYASMNAAREVGGDFYDFFLIDSHTLGFLIADVSGKGIPASLFMMAAKSELANYMNSGMDLAEAVYNANRNLCNGNEAGMFVTVWAATLDYETGELTYVNAGHNPPLLRHDGTWTWLKNRGGLFLGTFETARYRTSRLTLEPGDEILLYTDGVNEAFSAEGEEYGNDRLERFLSSHADAHPHVLVDMLRADVRLWAKGAEQSDDITIMCLEFGAAPEVSGVIEVRATREGLEDIKNRMHFELSNLGCPEGIQRRCDHTIEELFSNVCEHGYVDQEEPGKVELAWLYSPDRTCVTMSMTDWGVPFDPLGYVREDDAAADEVSGMGILIARGYADDISYVRDGDRNVVAFTKAW